MTAYMQAMVMTSIGGPEVLQLQSVPRPEISDPHNVLVRVMAAGVNPLPTSPRISRCLTWRCNGSNNFIDNRHKLLLNMGN
jgi:hypothetical protein